MQDKGDQVLILPFSWFAIKNQKAAIIFFLDVYTGQWKHFHISMNSYSTLIKSQSLNQTGELNTTIDWS